MSPPDDGTMRRVSVDQYEVVLNETPRGSTNRQELSGAVLYVST